LEVLIQARNLNKSFRNLSAVQGVNLQVASGEIYGMVGPDGAGKTTIIRLLVGALLPDYTAGAAAPGIEIAGFDMLRQTEEGRARLGYLPQRFSLYEDLTVMENLRFFAEVRGLSAADWQPRCMEILQFVGLDAFIERRAGYLSGGMKQKLGLAAALVHRPRVLLLDEPTTGVDPVTRQDFWQLIIRLASAGDSQGIAVLVSTPYMDEASRCDRVGFLRSGKLLVEGTPAELRSSLGEQIMELRGKPLSLLRRVAGAHPDVETVQMFGDRIHLRVRAGSSARVASSLPEEIADHGGEVSLLRQMPAQLEDVFISLLED
jgi:ABC-2 type transport system ATP-binding protein